jgi:predicted amidohydrolase
VTDSFGVAVVQAAPVYLDGPASAAKAAALIAEAGRAGARLAVFGETWLAGYPRWLNAPLAAAARRSLATTYLAAAVRIDGPELAAVRAAAADAGIDVVMGVAELDPVTAGTVYCTLAFIGADGTLLGSHRKLKPTDAERTVWGEGDGTGLNVHRRPYAAISGLNCWEHNMVLPGYALMAQGTQVHVAAFPGYESQPVSSTRQLLLARAFASQGACYVLLVGGVLDPPTIADPEVRNAVGMVPPLTGDSYVIDPRGEVIAGPAQGEEILYADCSLAAVRAAKAVCDVAGHYSRPDVLQLLVTRRAGAALRET